MSKKFMTGLLALVAFAAMALPAMASAKPFLQEGGTTIATGSKITGINVENTEAVMTTSLGNVTCSKVDLKGTITTNSTEKGVEGNIEAATFENTGSSECSSWTGGVTVNANPAINGLNWCVEATEANDNIKIRGNSCSGETRPIRFVLNFTSIGACVYQRTGAASGTLQTGTEKASITEQEWTKFEGGLACPSSGKLDMSFALKTENGTALTFAG